MIATTKIRDLSLFAPTAYGRPSHLSAASGLVCVKSFIYVIADDELQLGVFCRSDRKPGHLLRIFDGVLPESKNDRKKQKPDLEALCLLPPYGEYPHGALLMLGSGSKRNRRMGAILGLDEEGAVSGPPQVVDFSPVFDQLDVEFAALNIEGAIVSGDELRLLQRGNKRHNKNAVIRFILSEFLDTLSTDRSRIIKPCTINVYDLGEINGVPFCFTDAAALPDGSMVFTAVAEDTEDTYYDGPCTGAAIGVLDNDGHLRCLHRLYRPQKVEGVDAKVDGKVIRVVLVTDADDISIPAELLSATIEC